MPDEIRVNRPPQTQMHSQGSSMRQDMPPQQAEMEPEKNSKAPWIILAVVVVVIIVLGILFRGKLFNKGGDVATPAGQQASGYQAVFLTNGQVYFGKISNVDGDYVGLSDIFYLQVGPQQGSATGQTQTNTAQGQQQVSLVKLGNELHGPVDFMHISRAQILFYEDLKESGQVVQAINAYKASPTGSAPAPSPIPSH